ncbi:hypothetical protein LEMLEM_LOCUS10428, partial [Lemmus lemmus]
RAGEGFTWEDNPGKSQTERLRRDTGGEKRVICTDSQKKHSLADPKQFCCNPPHWNLCTGSWWSQRISTLRSGKCLEFKASIGAQSNPALAAQALWACLPVCLISSEFCAHTVSGKDWVGGLDMTTGEWNT